VYFAIIACRMRQTGEWIDINKNNGQNNLNA
jgi:hypothetical protein